MSPKFLNTNSHDVYVQNPGTSDSNREDLVRIGPGREYEATGALADNVEATRGVVRASSDEAKDYRGGKKGDDGLKKYPPHAEEILATDGEQSFPAEGEEVVMTDSAREAVEAAQQVASQEQQSQVNFASDEAGEKASELGLEMADLVGQEGSGKDGALTVKDVKKIADERESGPPDLEQLDGEGLHDLATEHGIDTESLLADVEPADQREALVAAIEEAQGDATATNEGDGSDGTATNEPGEGGTVTSDKVPSQS